jgi:predicted RNA methylase
MVATESLAFVRANLPAPPMRLLEIGAGDGALARALADAGYEVLAIDPDPTGAQVRPVALAAVRPLWRSRGPQRAFGSPTPTGCDIA